MNTEINRNPLPEIADPRYVFLRVLNFAWCGMGAVALLHGPLMGGSPDKIDLAIVAITAVTGLAVYLLTKRSFHRPAAYLFCLSVNMTFFALYALSHEASSAMLPRFAEVRGVTLAMSGLGVVFAGAMLGRWAALVFAAVNTVMLFAVVRVLLHNVGPGISVTVFWWLLGLSMWLYSTFLQRMVKQLKSAHADLSGQMAKLSENAALLNLSSAAIFIHEENGLILYWNRGAETLYGVKEADAIGRSFDELVTGDNLRLQKVIKEDLARDGRWHGELRQHTADLREIWVESRWALNRMSPERSTLLVINTDITEKKSQELKLAHLVGHDPLTDLPNRSLLNDRLGQAMVRARHSGKRLALMVIDLDRLRARFKSVTSGGLSQTIGESVLQTIAHRLRARVAKHDTVAHLAGDTFAIVLEDCGPHENLVQSANALLAVVAQPVDVQGQQVTISACVGVATFPSDIEDTAEMIRGADVAMAVAKEQGPNTVQFFDPLQDVVHLKRTLMANALRGAIEAGEFRVAYQPKLDMQTDRISGVEALLRWHSKEFGEVQPAEFIPLAEEIGIIVPIGYWVLRTACAQVQAWHRQGFDTVELAVNFSAEQFHQADAVASIDTILLATGLSPGKLELEITESTIMRSVEQTLNVMHELRRKGVELSIDDFGTGYSSLSYLKKFPVHALKIDQSFVRDLVTNHDDAAIVSGVISLAKSLGLRVIAEGVETAEQLAYLRALNCDEYQGYLFSRPLTAQAMEAMLHQQR